MTKSSLRKLLGGGDASSSRVEEFDAILFGSLYFCFEFSTKTLLPQGCSILFLSDFLVWEPCPVFIHMVSNECFPCCALPASQHHLLKKLPFLVCILSTYAKSYLQSYFFQSLFCSSNLCIYFYAKTCNVDYQSFIGCFEVR